MMMEMDYSETHMYHCNTKYKTFIYQVIKKHRERRKNYNSHCNIFMHFIYINYISI